VPIALALDDAADVPRLLEVEDQDRDVVLLHIARAVMSMTLRRLLMASAKSASRSASRWGLLGVGGVDAVDLGRLEQHVALKLGGAQGGAGVGREEGVAGARGEDDDAALLEVPEGAAADEGLGDGADLDGGHDAAVDAHA
jgi:hypothetical protein